MGEGDIAENGFCGFSSADGRTEGWKTADRPCAVLRIIAVPKEEERNAKEGRNVLAGGNFDHLGKEEGSREIATYVTVTSTQGLFIDRHVYFVHGLNS